ncbi:MAG: 16S rRNA (guanine(966)-N(2))-methyltransferase RsmD [Candidatus Aminicenantes bacterium 4484_214]|nr:MAG: 16S rRNA (guanine(966)-N(2))-methyltransferase RsmD [Candidatus Aminicenantes bacterium 4484_214]
MIRIVGGEFKGRKLKKVPSAQVRPISHRLKETLFNVLHDHLVDLVVLDGFAGTGSLGLEALSRGAAEVIFVDELPLATKIIKENVAKCEVENRVRILTKEFNRAIIQLAKEGKKFDLVFLDPPYSLLEERNPLKVLKKREVISPGGKIILRQHRRINFEPKYYSPQRVVVEGDDKLVFYEEEGA